MFAGSSNFHDRGPLSVAYCLVSVFASCLSCGWSSNVIENSECTVLIMAPPFLP